MDLRITCYSHYFSVFGYSANGRECRRAFADTFIETGPTKIRGRFIQEQKRIYARRDLKREEICFHINVLQEFKEHIAHWPGFRKIEYEILEAPMYEPEHFNFDWNEDYQPWEAQVPIIDFCTEPGKQKVITAEPGFGKAQPLNALIKVPGGWKRMGDIKVGDLVITPSGRIVRVLGVFPQGETQVWELTFSDGRKTRVNPDHLWSVKVNGSDWETRDTRDLLGFYLSDAVIEIPTVDFKDTEDTPLPEPLEVIAQKVLTLTDTEWRLPGVYLEASVSQRKRFINLLTSNDQDDNIKVIRMRWRGLQVENDIILLLRSVGYGVISGSSPLNGIIRFEDLNGVIKLDEIDTTLPDEGTQCILIDDPDHLYITDDYIVTHNTNVSLYAVYKHKVRTAVVTLGGYENRWLPEFAEKLKLKPHEYRSCCGCQKLYAVLREMKETGLPDVKMFFISNATIRDFIKNFNNGKVVGSGCEDIEPATLWEFLRVGLRITDEAHKEFHGHFIGDLHSHIPKTIYLTATLFAKVEFMNRMYEVCLPKKCRRSGEKKKPWVELVNVKYNLTDPKKARFIGGQGSYSHTTYEAWIMSDPKRLQRYMEGIYLHTEVEWYQHRKPNHKLLIFCATIELCQRLRDYFKTKFSNLVINSYTSGDDYQILLDSNIILSTLGKSGTAVDIPDLTQAYATVAVDSPNANIQALGRLRELKGEKKFPQSYHCFNCLQIDKHKAYWDSKVKLFSGRVTGIRTAYMQTRV